MEATTMKASGCRHTWQDAHGGFTKLTNSATSEQESSIQPQSLPLEAWRRAALLCRLLLQRLPHFRVRLLQQALLLQAVLCCARRIHAPLVCHCRRTLLQGGRHGGVRLGSTGWQPLWQQVHAM